MFSTKISKFIKDDNFVVDVYSSKKEDKIINDSITENETPQWRINARNLQPFCMVAFDSSSFLFLPIFFSLNLQVKKNLVPLIFFLNLQTS